jgi:hypothetical protein
MGCQGGYRAALNLISNEFGPLCVLEDDLGVPPWLFMVKPEGAQWRINPQFPSIDTRGRFIYILAQKNSILIHLPGY